MLGNKIVFSDGARQDIKESIEYYENRETGLGNKFLSEIKAKNQNIKNKPEKNPADTDGVRKSKLKKLSQYGILQGSRFLEKTELNR